MRLLTKHIILIGFKHVGKSCVGKELAHTLQANFIDLDKEIESLYEQKYGDKYTCRELVHINGEEYFRELECVALTQVMRSTPCVIALGGGTAMREENRKIIQYSIIVHLVANKHTVYQRILESGRPAIISDKEDLRISFDNMWDARTNVYNNCSDFTIMNHNTVTDTVNEIICSLNSES